MKESNPAFKSLLKHERISLVIFIIILTSTSVIIADLNIFDLNNFLVSFVTAVTATYVISRLLFKFSTLRTHKAIIKYCQSLDANVKIEKKQKQGLPDLVIDNWCCHAAFKVSTNHGITMLLRSAYSENNAIVSVPFVPLLGRFDMSLLKIKEVMSAQKWVIIAEQLKAYKFDSHCHEERLSDYQLVQTEKSNGLLKMREMEQKLNPVFFVTNRNIDITLCCIPPVRISCVDDETLRFVGNRSVDVDNATILTYKSGMLRSRHQVAFDQFTIEQMLALLLTCDEVTTVVGDVEILTVGEECQ